VEFIPWSDRAAGAAGGSRTWYRSARMSEWNRFSRACMLFTVAPFRTRII